MARLNRHHDGLSTSQVQARLKKYGYNEIPVRHAALWRRTLTRLWGPVPWLLEFTLGLEVLLGNPQQAVLIGLWLLFSAVVGSVQERRAHHALTLLQQQLTVTAKVCRDGIWQQCPARELVPGDKIRLTPGDLIPADCVLDAGRIDVDQSMLTGESNAISREAKSLVYASSVVCRGQASATVTATAASSYFGHTAELVQRAAGNGHLDRLLFAVVRYLIHIDLLFAALLAIAALFYGTDWLILLPFLCVLMIATVPITMPAAFTVANAVEARWLAKHGILVTGLSAVQEAATMDVLCIDKTGTLTHNRQHLAGVIPITADSEQSILRWAGAACDETTHSPLESAILEQLNLQSLQAPSRQQLQPFDPTTQRSQAVIDEHAQRWHVVLGAPESVQSVAIPSAGLHSYVEHLAANGARVLAVAAGPADHLLMRGLLVFSDTLRDDAPKLVRALQGLGVRVMLASGDLLATVQAVGREVGLGDRIANARSVPLDPARYDGFAQCLPQDKYLLIQRLQRELHVVGMTGDGINDAPALKQAEVGIAVHAATDVAKASAQVVLLHDGLEDMIAIIHSGRRVYRRMLTWTLTKICRTVELAALITICYLATGLFITSLHLIAILVVLNDVVTLTLATDRAIVYARPERWQIADIAKLATLLAIGWLLLGFVMVWMAHAILDLPLAQLHTLTFAFLIYSAQTTIYITRERRALWASLPSHYVMLATIGNIVLATGMGYFGLLTAPVPIITLGSLLLAVLAMTLLFDWLKLLFFRHGEMAK